MCSLAQYNIHNFSSFRKPQFFTGQIQDILLYECEGNVDVDGSGDVDGDGDKKMIIVTQKKNFFVLVLLSAHINI